jgi:hypothetical protein
MVCRHEAEENDSGVLIGVYQTESGARSAIEQLRAKPGFVNDPEGFQIHSRELDHTSWSEGSSLKKQIFVVCLKL